jgi:hypothetical protein
MFPYIGYSAITSLKFISIPYIIDRYFPLAEIISKYKNILLSSDKNIGEITSVQLNACLRFGVRQCQFFNTYKFNAVFFVKYKDKIDFIYKTGDKWCPEKTIEVLKPISNHKKVNIPHDFILSKEHRLQMMNEISI